MTMTVKTGLAVAATGSLLLTALMASPQAATAAAATPVSLAAPVSVATYVGSPPALPSEVRVTTSDGGEATDAVTWDLDGYTFADDYRTVPVFGTVTGGLTVSASVEVIPRGTLYFIDSGMVASTPPYEAVKSLIGDGLKNGSADQQASGQSDGWGYVNDGNAYVAPHAGSLADKDSSGLYALGSGSTSKPIIYDLPLTAGGYTLTAGFQEWWNNREMKVDLVSPSGADTVIAPDVRISTNGANGPKTQMVSHPFTVSDADAGVQQLRVTINGGSGAPVISWLAVASGSVPVDATPLPVATPTADVAGGIYKNAQTVNLATTTAGAAIYYTTDGTDASRANGSRYTGPITVASTQTVKAVAFADGVSSKQLSLAYDIEPDPGTYASVPVGHTWYDTAGTPIQAHGGNILEHAGWYYWVGENKTSNSTRFEGISLYKSQDLKNWTYVKDILTASSAPELVNCNVERPKLLYNAETDSFVLWGHWERATDYSASHLMVATSKTVDGDYTFQRDFRPGAGHVTSSDPDPTYVGDGNLWGYGSRDFTIFQDGANGDAWLVSTQNGTDMRVYKLTDDYTGVDWRDSYTLFAGDRREAPALVKVGGYYFVFTSSQSGWYPNQAMYSYTKNIGDPNAWSKLAPVGNNTTFYSQPTNILPLTGPDGTSHYIYMGDRWNPGRLGASTYVWLPLDFSGTTGDDPSVAMKYEPTWSFDAATGSISLPTDRLASQGRPVVATSATSSHPASDANDGDLFNLNTSGDDTNYYQPRAVPFSWSVDLGESKPLSRIDLSFRSYNGSETYSAYTVAGSNDNATWTPLVARSANTTVGFTSDALRGEYRYVRVSVSRVVNDHNGNEADWAAGLVEVQVFSNPRGQTISFGALKDAVIGSDDLALAATSSSGLPVAFAAAGSCTVTGATLHLTGVGKCTVTASQAGNADYLPASAVSRSFDVVYGVAVQTDLSRPVHSGSTLPLKLIVTDASDTNLSSADLAVRAVGIDGEQGVPAPGRSQPTGNFRFLDADQSYHFNLSTLGLNAGDHNLAFTVGTDPSTHTITFHVVG